MWVEDYLRWCRRRGLRPRYVEEISRTLTRLERDLGPLTAITACEIEDWWDALTVNAASRNVYYAHLAGYYRWACRGERRTDDPTQGLVRPRYQRRLPRPITDERLRVALERAEQPILAWLALACYMGLRAHEIATLRGEDIIGDRLLVRDGKGGRQRILPLHAQVVELLNGTPFEGPLWANSYGAPLTANAVSHRTNRFLRSLEIPETLHQLRHWFGTTVYRESRDLRLTQELMGHASPLTTAGYAAWDSANASSVVGRLAV